ncbi:MAG: hypothetical protein V8Q29_05205 [Alistipes shahii]
MVTYLWMSFVVAHFAGGDFAGEFQVLRKACASAAAWMRHRLPMRAPSWITAPD